MQKSSQHLIVGYGEVGRALETILGSSVHDPFQGKVFGGECGVLHICFPYNQDFIGQVINYKRTFKPKITVIHSTVPVGTSRVCEAVHSPIRGVHPNLEEGIRTFTKYFGGDGAKEVAEMFEGKGIKCKVFERPEETEAGKLWSTTQYGAMIMLNKEIYRWCEDNGLDFEIVYTEFNKTYNEGFKALGREEVIRPVLKHVEGKIGGHCVVNNANLFESETAKKLKKQ